MNPFCEIALEEAVQIKERKEKAGKGPVEVVALSIGSQKAQETLRTALAKGADKAIHLEVDNAFEEKLEPIHVARAISKLVETDKYDMIILGKQAIDDDANQTGQMVAGYLNWPQATFASKVEEEDGGTHLKVTREIDGGLDIVRVKLPALPRYSTLPNIMKAKKKPLEKKALKDLGIDLSLQTEILEVTEPPARQAGGFVDDVPSLVKSLREKGVIYDAETDTLSESIDKKPLNSARILTSKFTLSQYAVENMDFVIEYILYNVGDRTALKVTMDDRNSFPTQSFEIVKGFLHVHWEEIASGENVTHSVIVRPRTFGIFNYTSAMVTYYPTNDAKQAIVSYSTAPGEGNIYRLKDYERRFASKISVWIGFLLLAMPTTVLPFIIWFQVQKKYAKTQIGQKKNR
uniref:Electron transfer flavoprotein subunit beta n=1 Tax=Meloidogyne javanica TaxID=6303 RepID=A0A915N5W2_MELJA